MTLSVLVLITQCSSTAYLFQCHAVLNKQCYPGVEVADIFLEYEVLLRL